MLKTGGELEKGVHKMARRGASPGKQPVEPDEIRTEVPSSTSGGGGGGPGGGSRPSEPVGNKTWIGWIFGLVALAIIGFALWHSLGRPWFGGQSTAGSSSNAAATEPTSTPTAVPSASRPLVTSGVGSPFPTLFQEQSTGKGAAFAYDIGVNAGQHGIVFGQYIQWEGKTSGDIQTRCGLVVLEPGFYRALYIVDGRYEIRDLPMGNEGFWKQKLAVDRAVEQREHYGCSDKKFEEIPVWKSSNPSPPAAVTQSTTSSVTAVPTATPKTQSIQPTATPVPPAPTATTAPAAERRLSGERQAIQFNTGESVYGWEIELGDGRKCTGSECYLPSAPMTGKVTSGVVNPWNSEISAKAKANPWSP